MYGTVLTSIRGFECDVQLSSYNPVWLRLGIETTFGVLLASPSTSADKSVSRLGARCTTPRGTKRTPEERYLRKYIKDRVLMDPEIIAKHKSTKAGLFGAAFHSEIHRHTLRRFLLLVAFMDQAKQESLLPFQLFNTSSDVKSSKDMVVKFSALFLSGEGAVMRHLSLLDYKVQYEQSYLDEVEYHVDNLATDFKDGVLLAR